MKLRLENDEKKTNAEEKEKEEEKIIRRPKIKHVIRTCLKMTACIQHVYILSIEWNMLNNRILSSVSFAPDKTATTATETVF